MRQILLVSTLLFTTLALFSCKEEENNPIPPPEEQPQINLSLEDASCTEAWIKLSTGSLALPSNIDLYRDSSLIETINLTSEDTVLYVDSLLPNHTYKYQSVIQSTGQSGNLLSVTTMDTTSHNFSFQSWTFGGQAGSCVLNDVAIIDENNIWAVGEIYLLDTLGQPDPDRYNLAVWDGNNWEIKRVPYYYQGQPFYHPIRSVFAFGANDIWFCGNGLIHWDGNQYNPVAVPNWGPYWMNKIWGTSDNDLYVVGDNGHIAHYQNGQWSRIESGTDMSLADIVGTSDGDIFICGSDASHIRGLILKKSSSGWETIINSRYLTPAEIFKPDLYGSLPSIWIDEKNTLYAAGNILYQYKFGRWDYVHSLPENFILGDPGLYYRGYIADVKGIKSNDMWIAGDRNTLRHFNGVSWKQIGHPYSPDSDIGWETIYPTENCAVVVGYKGNSAIVMLIKK